MREIHIFFSVFEGSLSIFLGLMYFHPDHITNKSHPPDDAKKFFSPSSRGPKWGWEAKKGHLFKILAFFRHFGWIYESVNVLKAWKGMKLLCCSKISASWPIWTSFWRLLSSYFVILGQFWLKKARFATFDDYNWFKMGWNVSPWVSFGEYQWYVGISMDNNCTYHNWPSKLPIYGWYQQKIH